MKFLNFVYSEAALALSKKVIKLVQKSNQGLLKTMHSKLYHGAGFQIWLIDLQYLIWCNG